MNLRPKSAKNSVFLKERPGLTSVLKNARIIFKHGVYMVFTDNKLQYAGVFSAAHDLKMEWVVIKGISDYADGTASLTENWRPFASVMAASVVNNILRNPVVFEEWLHYPSSDLGRTQNEGAVK